MTGVIDIVELTMSLKANEQMIAFAGFLVRPEEEGPDLEGILKMSAFYRPDKTGYLTLTFIVDTENDKDAKTYVGRLFGNLSEESLRPIFGRELVVMVKTPLDYAIETQDWYIEEVNLYFRPLYGREYLLVEEKLIPALSVILPFSFDPVEWWPGDQAGKTSLPVIGDKGHPQRLSIKDLFKLWFDSISK